MQDGTGGVGTQALGRSRPWSVSFDSLRPRTAAGCPHESPAAPLCLDSTLLLSAVMVAVSLGHILSHLSPPSPTHSCLHLDTSGTPSPMAS